MTKFLRLEVGTDIDQIFSIRQADVSNKINVLFDPWNIRAKSDGYPLVDTDKDGAFFPASIIHTS